MPLKNLIILFHKKIKGRKIKNHAFLKKAKITAIIVLPHFTPARDARTPKAPTAATLSPLIK